MSTVVPILRYADQRAAIEFLEQGLGFTTATVDENDEGVVVHAELKRGASTIMLSNSETSTPSEVYLVDEDPDALFASAVEAGAEVLYEPKDQDYGSREFGVKDPQGTIWYVGTYQP